MKEGLFFDRKLTHDNRRRFYGDICVKHPSLQGERRRLDGECVACHDQRPAEKHDGQQR